MTQTGTVQVTVRFTVSDADALLDAGRRSVARDGIDWQPGQPSPVADDPDGIIDTPAQAVVDLLIEGLVRCFRPFDHSAAPLVDQVRGLEDMEWGARSWTPAEPKEEA
jgi:hypothetical protein